MSAFAVRCASGVLLGLAVLVTACGDDAEPGRTGTPVIGTPVGTKIAVPIGTAASPTVAAVAPTPAEPPVDEALESFGRGQFTAMIGPGEAYIFDPSPFIEPRDGRAPRCTSDEASLGISWQVTAPYPPDGVLFVWRLDKESGPVTVGEGPDGDAATPCGQLEAVNNGSGGLTVEVRYVISALPDG